MEIGGSENAVQIEPGYEQSSNEIS